VGDDEAIHVVTLRRIAVALSWMACAVAFLACGGAPKHVHTEAKAWEPPDTFDDLPRAPGSHPSVAAEPEPAAPEPRTAPAATSTPHQPSQPAPPEPPSGGTVTVTPHGFPLGTKIDLGARMAIQALFTVETPNGDVTVEDFENIVDHHTLEVLQILRGNASKVRASFEDKSSTRIINARQTRVASPVEGKSYVLEARADGLSILDDKGKDVSAGEGQVLSQEFRTLGTGDAVTRAMPSAPMAVGRAVPALAEALKSDFGRSIDGRVFFGNVSVTPTGGRRVAGVDCVAFAVVLQVGFEVKDRKVRMDTKGEMVLRADNAWPVSMDLVGPVAVDLTEHGVPAHGVGKSRFTGTYAYP
jgi:hypothetical protein